MSELISVIVPVYNVEAYLDKCILSVVQQSYADLEIILVDDGATDSSGEICDDWAERDSRIKVIHKENGGLSDARNAGIEIASGCWFSFIDSDDYITPDAIEQLHTAAAANGCQMAVCNIIRIFDDGETQPFYQPTAKLTVLQGAARFDTLCQPSVCNKLFRRELFNGVRFPKGKYYEDTFVYHILAHRADKIALTGHDGYFYLSRWDSILGQSTYTDRYFDMVEAVHHRVSYLLEKQIPKYSMEACLSLYAVVSNAEKNLIQTSVNAKKFEKMREWYVEAYTHLISRSDVNLKQKLRLILLRYAPKLHSRIY